MKVQPVQPWSDLLGILQRGERAVLVTVLLSEGSSPREAGTRLLVESGGFRGTIGGGALEWRALAKAGALLARAEPAPAEIYDQVLGPDLGQCCGGRVRLLLETFGPDDLHHVSDLVAPGIDALRTEADLEGAGPRLRRRIVPGIAAGELFSYDRATDRVTETFTLPRIPVLLYGAGHVGRATALALAPLPFAVTWVDPRPDAFPSLLPASITARVEIDPLAPLIEAAHGTLVAVMTHSHALDFDVVAAALSDERFPFVGLIGSATKRAQFLGRLQKLGVDPARLVCPIGLAEIRGKEPPVIAASVAAQLLVERTNMNALKRPELRDVAHG